MKRSGSSLGDYPWLAHRPNADVPAFGLMVDNGTEDTDGGSRRLLTIVMQAAGNLPVYVNGPGDCASGQPGICYQASNRPGWIAYNPSSGTPAVGELWGPTPGSFLAVKNPPGFSFRILRAGSNGIVWAIPGRISAKARWIEIETTVDFDTSNGTVNCNVLDWHDGEDPDPDDAGLDVVNTQAMFYGDMGSVGVALYSPEDDTYYLVQLKCQACVS